MNTEQTIEWFEEVAQAEVHHNDHAQVAKWMADAQSAIESVFPAQHAICKQWHNAIQDIPAQAGIKRFAAVTAARGIFRSALGQLKHGRLTTLVRSVQADTVSELLDQALVLLEQKYRVAAAVVAGGALETHLRHLCVQNSVSWNGDGSISKYDQAIAKQRNDGGKELYSATDSKQITAWGGMRNDAAHDPANFTTRAEEIRLMIQGVRQFIARTS